MALTDTQVRALLPRERAYKKFDGRGLYIEVAPTGSKLWRLKFRYDGTEKRLALGVYPFVKLADARRGCEAARLQLTEGVDPCLQRKRLKATRRVDTSNTFLVVANEFIRKREKEGTAEATAKKARWFLKLLEPTVGSVPLNDIDPHLLLSALKSIERRGCHETAKKARSFASRVFRYGVATGRGTSDPAALLSGALIAPKPKHRAAILDQKQLAAFLNAADGYGSPVTRLALKILPHVYLRPGELRFTDWAEIHFEKAVWVVPAERAKMRRAQARSSRASSSVI